MLIAAIGVLAGLVMAATVATVTGWAVLLLRTEVRCDAPSRERRAPRDGVR
jgi:hypothetical protein